MKTNALCPIQLSLDNDRPNMPMPVVKLMTYLQAPTSPGYMESPQGQQLLQGIGAALVEEWMALTPFPTMPDLLLMQFSFTSIHLHVMVMLTPDHSISLNASESHKKAQISAAINRLDHLLFQFAESSESFKRIVHPAELEEQQALAMHFLKTYEQQLEKRLVQFDLGFQWTAPLLSYPIWDIDHRPQIVPPVGLFFRSGGDA